MKRILCLETEWGINNKNRLSDNASIRSLFQFIEKCEYLNTSVSYRTVATVDELRYYLSQMPKAMYEDYEIVYLAFHGKRGRILLHKALEKNTVEDYVSLEQLGEMCSNDWLKGKHVIFGACLTLSAAESKIMEFKKRSGAESVVGYNKIVDFVKGSILDIALINEILNPKPKKLSLEERMNKRLGGMVEEQGMVFY